MFHNELLVAILLRCCVRVSELEIRTRSQKFPDQLDAGKESYRCNIFEVDAEPAIGVSTSDAMLFPQLVAHERVLFLYRADVQAVDFTHRLPFSLSGRNLAPVSVLVS